MHLNNMDVLLRNNFINNSIPAYKDFSECRFVYFRNRFAKPGMSCQNRDFFKKELFYVFSSLNRILGNLPNYKVYII
jgi:hypothetical protein